MSVFVENRRYCVMRDCEVARLSMRDDHGGEFWREVVVEQRDEHGKRVPYRDVRSVALDAIEAAIAKGDEPGEVG